MSMIPEGRHPARLIDYGFSKSSKAGTLQLVCTFEVDADDTTYQISWFGYFSEKARANTIKTLMEVLDLWCEPSEINDKLAQIAANGKISGLLNMEKEYSLVIEHEAYEGKVRAKVKWLNNPGSGMQFEKMAQSEAKSMFAGMNLAGEVASVKAKNPQGGKKFGDDIPF